MHNLDELRLKLDALDHQIATLLNDRIEVVNQIGLLKKRQNLAIEDEKREKLVIDHVKSAISHPILKEEITEIYQLIIQDSKINQQFIRSTDFPFRRVGFIGFGLTGGSIGKAIKTKLPEVMINVLQFEDLSKALSEKWIDKICATTHELARSSDLILLATPIASILPRAHEIAGITLEENHPIVIADVASVKDEIVTHFEKLSHPRMEFIGTHPMAGKELSGLSNSAATLFVNKPWIVTPHSANSKTGLKKIEQMIEFCGGNPYYLEKDQHDKQMALVSHLPAFLARRYLQFVQRSNLQALELAGPGFDSFTRLAHDNPILYNQIQQSNSPNIDHYLKEWIDFLTS